MYKIYKIKPSTESRSPVPAARMAGRQTAVDRSMHIIRTAPRQVNSLVFPVREKRAGEVDPKEGRRAASGGDSLLLSSAPFIQHATN